MFPSVSCLQLSVTLRHTLHLRETLVPRSQNLVSGNTPRPLHVPEHVYTERKVSDLHSCCSVTHPLPPLPRPGSLTSLLLPVCTPEPTGFDETVLLPWSHGSQWKGWHFTREVTFSTSLICFHTIAQHMFTHNTPQEGWGRLAGYNCWFCFISLPHLKPSRQGHPLRVTEKQSHLRVSKQGLFLGLLFKQ